MVSLVNYESFEGLLLLFRLFIFYLIKYFPQQVTKVVSGRLLLLLDL